MVHSRRWLGAVLLLAPVGSAAAQELPFPLRTVSFEARGELAFPTGQFRRDLDLNTGYGLGVVAKYRFIEPLGVYAGWDRFRFRGGTASSEAIVRDAGFRLGAQLHLPGVAATPLLPFLTGGLLFSRLEVERPAPDERSRDRSDRSLGFEIGAGTLVHLGRGVWLIPEGRYRSHSPGLDGVEEVSYFGLNLGLALRLF
jgi:hypothetical protein